MKAELLEKAKKINKEFNELLDTIPDEELDNYAFWNGYKNFSTGLLEMRLALTDMIKDTV